MDIKIKGKVAIVTGASRGLGFAAAQALADEGAKILATGRSVSELEALAKTRPGAIVPVPCDMRDIAAVEALPARAVSEFGRLDIVVNNAGIAPAGAFLEQTHESLSELMVVNVIAPAMLSKAAGAIMVEQRSGKIINIASISGIRGKAVLVGYSASKGAVLQMTKALAAEWARHNIQVNAIAPGGFATEAQAAVVNNPDVLKKRVRKIPASRMAMPDEMGAMVCYLASPLSDFVTGAVMVIDGGETAKI
ncbi:SDR family NAD(P)-dependent oxidoreductase [Sphingopyxis sp. GW247-27LB]|uniref:SDR family NAD(P)-dependent oxidoreductase n=1 Tax=Sphingopyxis sp. GW247-27LB TaxID=2012632 RepID=UPI000BA7BB19|nr:glucose 1-dehydrogenase [Sphingopyxis sp. GW247-27LB]PAL21504.1 2-deoxy-D-gluconate 3-dehydrogenase [Sphingopyxis sp. GW247-27LB]